MKMKERNLSDRKIHFHIFYEFYVTTRELRTQLDDTIGFVSVVLLLSKLLIIVLTMIKV